MTDKIIATDLDGTLFYPKDTINMIPKENLIFLRKFIDDGGHLILVSGRSVDYGKKVVHKIERDCTFIGFNGAAFLVDGKIYATKPIPNDMAKTLIAEISKNYKIVGAMIMTDKGLRIHSKSKSRLYRWAYSLYYNHQGVYQEIHDLSENKYLEAIEEETIYKIMIYFGLGRKKKKRARQTNELLRYEYPDFECAWSDNVIEITSKGATKANAIKKYCELSGLNDKEVYVIGDSGNDVSMFEAFKENSFCMSHSPSNVRKHASYTIDKVYNIEEYIYKNNKTSEN